MKHEYVKYRDFLRNFKTVRSGLSEDTLYEVVGTGGVTVGFFSLKNPCQEKRQ